MQLLKNDLDLIDYDDIEIKLLGCELDQEDYLVIRKKLNLLQFKTPFNSKIKLVLHPYKDSFKGSLALEAWNKTFEVNSASKDVISTVEFLLNDIEEQIIFFKRNRFINNQIISDNILN